MNATHARILTICLLFISNTFMTFGWYWHLKYHRLPLFEIILTSWMIALFEYFFMIPANRIGYSVGNWSGYQLKIVQEVVTLLVFVGFAFVYLHEKPRWNYAVSFLFIVGAVISAFWGKF